jgi:hypothetical protein
MNTLSVSRLSRINYNTDLDTVSAELNRLPQYQIAQCSWVEYTYKPVVNFMIAYGEDCLLIKFVASEKELRAVHTTTHAPVWEDSCVEMFIRFRDDGGYYNLEVNCLGTMLAAYGADRQKRVLLPLNIVRSIRRASTIYRESETDNVEWETLLIIPLTTFMYDNLVSLTGVRARANFYKCGDGLAEPHYLSWSPIISARPDFHLPAFFGNLHFTE